MKQVMVGEVCHLVNGKAFKPSDWSETGAPIIRIQNLNGVERPFNYWNGPIDRQVEVKDGDVLLAWSGTPGTSFGVHIWNRGPGILNQHIFRVDLDASKVTPRWFMYVVNGQLSKLIAKAHGGVGLQHVTRPMVDSLEIPLPPLDEQRRIAAILDKADALRRKRKRTLELLDTLIQSIFLEMFGDPLSNHKRCPSIELGSITSKIGSGATPTGGDASYKTSGVSLIRSMNVRDEGFLRNGIVFLDEAQAAKLDNVTVEKDDVLLNITGASVARVCLCPEAILPARVNQHVSIIRPKNMLLSPYIADLLKTPSMKGRLLQLAEAGATRQAITKAQIEKLAIPMPADDDLKAYARAINSHRSVRGQMAEAVTTAGQAFTSLQHRAFSGQL